MLKTLIIFSVTLGVVFGEDTCASLWQNDTLMEECCKGLYDIEVDDMTENERNKCLNNNYCAALKCMMSTRNVLVDGKIDDIAMLGYLLKGRADTVWAKPLENSIKTCSEKMVDKECPEDFFLDCLEIAIVLECPKSQWDEKCEDVKNILSGCI